MGRKVAPIRHSAGRRGREDIHQDPVAKALDSKRGFFSGIYPRVCLSVRVYIDEP